METYLDLKTGVVVCPPYRYIFSDRSIISAPINEQLYFLDQDDNNIIVYAPYEQFAALINKKECEYLLNPPNN